MSSITDPLHDIFLAGVGALSIGAEKSKEIVDHLVQQGQITVEQGRGIATDLEDQAKDRSAEMRDRIIAAHMKGMTKAERDEFAARVAEMAAQQDGDDALQGQEAEEISADAAGK